MMNTFVSLAAFVLLTTGLCVNAHPPGHHHGFGPGRSDSDREGARQRAQEEMNRKIVLTFYQELFGDHDPTTVDRYVDPNYIQHNPQVADGPEPIKAFASGMMAGLPKSTIDVRRSAAEGDLVWLHLKSGNQAIVDIFRLKNGKIVEHWDVIQDIPTTAANSHPMF